jgi:predicted RNase H-like HicB family nuclease
VKSKIVFTEEDGTWSAHDPDVPGVYGLGPTRAAAKADLREALTLLADYVASQADDEAEDAEDIRLADESRAEIRADGVTIPLEDVLKRYGLTPEAEADLCEAPVLLADHDADQADDEDDEDEDAEDVRAADASMAEVLAGGRLYTHEEVLKRYGLAPAAEAEADLLETSALPAEHEASKKGLQPEAPVGSQTLGPQTLGPQTLGPQTFGPQTLGPQTLDNETIQRRWKRFLRGDGVDPRPEVAQLLANIKAALPALEALNEDDDTEDGMYRFYYGSWKVYGLQERTEQIVAKLRALAPVQGKSLCTDFEEIVAAGTGKEWEQFHNAEWAKHTRPIVEAYFHARYFLVVAIEYGAKYERPPSLMANGWAALLVLYGLR